MTRESSDAPEPSSSEIPPGLAFESSVPQRIEALQRLLSVAAVASAIGVTPEALRQWKTQAASIRPSNSNALDDLRCAAATLFEAGYDDQSVSNWLTSRHAPRAKRPIELIRERPEAVLAAIAAHVDGDDDEAADILAEASAAKAGLRRHPMATAAAEPSDTEYKLDTLERLTRLPPARIPEALDEAARWLETDRPFYVRSDRVLKKLMDMPADQVPSEAQSERDEDAGVLERFREIGARIICDIAASSGGRARILTYAKSVHVVEALKGVPREIQEESTLYVAECRSKARRFDVTEASFADARGLLEDLEETAYDTLLVIDSDAAGLLASRSKEIDLVVLGAQEIQTEDGRPAHFVNTPGTDALVRVARDCNTPVYVLVPDDPEKFTVVSDFNPPRKFDDPPWPSEDAGPVLRRTKLLRLKSERIQIDPARIHVYTENGLLTTRDDSASDAA